MCRFTGVQHTIQAWTEPNKTYSLAPLSQEICPATHPQNRHHHSVPYALKGLQDLSQLRLQGLHAATKLGSFRAGSRLLLHLLLQLRNLPSQLLHLLLECFSFTPPCQLLLLQLLHVKPLLVHCFEEGSQE